MSPLYLPIKRKCFQSSKPCPVQQSTSELNIRNDFPHFEQDSVLTQMNGTKRFEELQSVPLSSISYPSSSGSSGMSSCLTDGTCPGFVVPKDEWITAESTTRQQGWSCTQDGSSEPWTERREAWGCVKVQSEGQGEWSSSGDGGGVEKKWRSEEGAERGWCQGLVTGREEGWREQPWSNSAPVCSKGSNPSSVGDSAPQSNHDHKPPAVPVKKEHPTYPAGSPEEGWQAQIVSRGRVSCPRCKSVSRKTVEGLKKHMDNCRLEPFSCPHCGKQLKSSTGMKYHIMADHSLLPSSDDLDERAVKEKLRKILKKLGKLKCSQEGCSAAFTSIMGYFYHMRTCGKAQEELEKMALKCSQCGRTYRSKAGLVYHLKNEHAPVTVKIEEEDPEAQPEETAERTACGRVQRASAQVANLHMAHIAQNQPPKDWDKRKFSSDLVPDDKKLKYTRPGLPAFSQEVLRRWRSEVKLHKKIHCPNKGCGCTYTSVSGLKAHLGLCTKGEFEAGKYRCLICNKEFNSESGVKYHINSVHAQDWFVTNKKASKKFEKLLKSQPKHLSPIMDQHSPNHYQHHQNQTHFHHFHHHFVQSPNQIQPPLQPLHHLQPQNYFMCKEHHPIPPQSVPKMDYHPSPVQYTPLQPVWVDERLAKHQEDVKIMDEMRDGVTQRNGPEFVREDANSGVNSDWR